MVIYYGNGNKGHSLQPTNIHKYHLLNMRVIWQGNKIHVCMVTFLYNKTLRESWSGWYQYFCYFMLRDIWCECWGNLKNIFLSTSIKVSDCSFLALLWQVDFVNKLRALWISNGRKVPWNGAVSMRSCGGSWETWPICIAICHFFRGAPADRHANVLGILII